jgi:hypothetical protein
MAKDRYVIRTNPSNVYIRATDLHPGDVIEMEDLGREHVIEGPFRSGRGVRFVDKYGTSIILRSNERVKLVARENPSFHAKKISDAKLKKKFDHCVKKVSKRGTAYSPYAVCTAQMKRKYGIRKARNNPTKRRSTSYSWWDLWRV